MHLSTLTRYVTRTAREGKGSKKRRRDSYVVTASLPAAPLITPNYILHRFVCQLYLPKYLLTYISIHMYLIAHYLLPTSSYVYTILFFFHVGQTCVDGQQDLLHHLLLFLSTQFSPMEREEQQRIPTRARLKTPQERLVSLGAGGGEGRILFLSVFFCFLFFFVTCLVHVIAVRLTQPLSLGLTDFPM